MTRLAVVGPGDGWHVRDLLRAAADFGVTAEALDFRRLGARTGPAADSLSAFDAVLVRTMPAGSLEQVVFRMDVLHRAAARGARVVNSPAALETSIDKYLSLAKLEAAGLPVPPTVVAQSAEEALTAFAQMGGDVVVKPLFGSEGRGMVRLTDGETAWRTFHALERMQFVLYVQKFERHAGWDARAFVIGGRVVAAMRRYGHGDWRTNVAQGGRAEVMELTPTVADLAVRSASAVGAEVAGVDVVAGESGWVVLEVNAVPGWKALAAVNGMDVAARILTHVRDR